jgi:hypothetical protein
MFNTLQQAWDAAVIRNTVALRAVVLQLVGLLAIYGGMDAVAVPRAVHSRIVRLLRPAESALRRLIVIAARDVRVVFQPPQRKLPQRPAQMNATRHRSENGSPRASSSVAFQLFDPRKRFGRRRMRHTRFPPRVYFIAADPPYNPLFQKPEPPAQPVPEILAGARRLCRRLKALSVALEDVPRQAQRLARLRARRAHRNSFISPLRPGKPPGHRKIPGDGIDLVLAECHAFAHAVLTTPVTSGLEPNTS